MLQCARCHRSIFTAAYDILDFENTGNRHLEDGLKKLKQIIDVYFSTGEMIADAADLGLHPDGEDKVTCEFDKAVNEINDKRLTKRFIDCELDPGAKNRKLSAILLQDIQSSRYMLVFLSFNGNDHASAHVRCWNSPEEMNEYIDEIF